MKNEFMGASLPQFTCICIQMWECLGSYGFSADWLPCITIFQYLNAK